MEDKPSLFKPAQIGPWTLANRIVMAPMTRSRAVEANTPNARMAEYYAQRASVGLIVTEGTSPSPNGTGYSRIPGIWNAEQIKGWKLVTEAVHARGGHIIVQLMHTGRVAHVANLPTGAEVLAPSAVQLEGAMYTDAQGKQPHTTPRAMSEADIEATLAEYVQAARNAMEAGFDGVELHAANGYLLEQFLSPVTNRRTDAWGGSVEKRLRFVVEAARRTAEAIGGERVGMRLSPYGANGGMEPYPELEETYHTLARLLIPTGLSYLHLVDHSAMGAPAVPERLKRTLRREWPRTLILCGGFERESAEHAIVEGWSDLVAFGRPFISNPDFVRRLEERLPLTPPDFNTFYSPGPEGYTDYPNAL